MRSIATGQGASVKIRRLDEETVHALAAEVLLGHLPLKGRGKQSSPEKVLDVLLAASAARSSIERVCEDHQRAPSANTVRAVLEESLSVQSVEEALNSALLQQLHKRYWKKPLKVAVDLHQQPYYGRPEKQEDLRAGPHKAGTHRFHTYATLYIIRRKRRVTLALGFVPEEEKMVEVLRTLKRRLDRAGLRVGLWMADKGFGQVEALKWFSRQRLAYVPLSVYGRKDPPSATRALAALTHSCFVPYTMSSRNHKKKLSFTVAVVRLPGGPSRSGRSEKQERTLLYAVVGKEAQRHLRSLKPEAVARQYEKRFGIESSYRQLRQGRARTSSRSVPLRLLLVGIALLLRNLWVLCQWIVSARRGPGARPHRARLFAFEVLLRWIQSFLSVHLQYRTMIELQAPSPLRF